MKLENGVWNNAIQLGIAGAAMMNQAPSGGSTVQTVKPGKRRLLLEPLDCPLTWKVKCRRGKKLTKTARLLKYLSSNIGYRIYRWQSVADWGSGTQTFRSLPLSLKNDQISQASSTLLLPMYAFNLGTMPKGKVSPGPTGALSNVDTLPMYRLVKKRDASGYYYAWIGVNGLRNDPNGTPGLGSSSWSEEYVHGKGSLASYDCVDNAYHAWDDIKMLISGPTLVPSWINVAIGRFLEYSWGPNRNDIVDENPRSYQDNQVATVTAFWDEFFARKCRNPVLSSGYHHVKPILKFKFHKPIQTCPSLSINSDARPKTVLVDLKHDVSRIENLVYGVAQIRNSSKVLDNTAAGAPPPPQRERHQPFRLQRSDCLWKRHQSVCPVAGLPQERLAVHLGQ